MLNHTPHGVGLLIVMSLTVITAVVTVNHHTLLEPQILYRK